MVGRGDAAGVDGLRCGELIACDITDVGSHSWHHTLALRTTKGDKPTVVALAPPTIKPSSPLSVAGVPGRCCSTGSSP